MKIFIMGAALLSLGACYSHGDIVEKQEEAFNYGQKCIADGNSVGLCANYCKKTYEWSTFDQREFCDDGLRIARRYGTTEGAAAQETIREMREDN